MSRFLFRLFLFISSGESRKSGGKRGAGSRVKNRVIKPKKMKQHKTDAKSRGKRTTNQRKK